MTDRPVSSNHRPPPDVSGAGRGRRQDPRRLRRGPRSVVVGALAPVVAAAAVLLVAAACGDERDPDPEICSGGSCDTAVDCQEACESACQDPDFGSFDCIDEVCVCECFFGCP